MPAPALDAKGKAGAGAACKLRSGGAQAPEYMLERDPNADEHGSTCLLRFTAGPPYEDVYFKILNKEWGARPLPGLA